VGIAIRRQGVSTAARRRGALVAAVAILAGLLTPAGATGEVKIRRTAHGIPHILADSYRDLGRGYGYAFAQDNLCVMADTYVTVRAERSRYFGPDESYVNRGNGSTANNLNSDFFYQRIIDEGTIEDLLDADPPLGPRDEVRQMVRGYVAGYNRYLEETGVDDLPDPSCRGEEWVKPIQEIDAYRRFYQLALLASSGVAIDGIAEAQPPTPPPGPVPTPEEQADFISQLGDQLPLGAIGSNAYGLGKQAPPPAGACCWATPTSRGTGPSASTRPSSRFPVRSTSAAGACSACRWC